MPKVSVNILTKNRAVLLRKALASVKSQKFKDLEVRVISDGSTDNTDQLEKEFQDAGLDVHFVIHNETLGISKSRAEALEMSKGEYIAILDDDDFWIDSDKLKKQVDFLDKHPDYVLVGGAVEWQNGNQIIVKHRPQSNWLIHVTMLFRNNFFTSTVMFRRGAAINAGGFISDGADVAEDYDLWLRLGKIGNMHNFREPFAAYAVSDYNTEKKKSFFAKQLALIKREKSNYPFYFIAALILRFRMPWL